MLRKPHWLACGSSQCIRANLPSCSRYTAIAVPVILRFSITITEAPSDDANSTIAEEVSLARFSLWFFKKRSSLCVLHFDKECAFFLSFSIRLKRSSSPVKVMNLLAVKAFPALSALEAFHPLPYTLLCLHNKGVGNFHGKQ